MEKTQENNPVNFDILAGRWKHMRGELRSWWGRLTEDDLEQIGGQHDKLIGKLQERYSYTRERAQQRQPERNDSADGNLNPTGRLDPGKGTGRGVLSRGDYGESGHFSRRRAARFAGGHDSR